MYLYIQWTTFLTYFLHSNPPFRVHPKTIRDGISVSQWRNIGKDKVKKRGRTENGRESEWKGPKQGES
jgi:hypothetical protein